MSEAGKLRPRGAVTNDPYDKRKSRRINQAILRTGDKIAGAIDVLLAQADDDDVARDAVIIALLQSLCWRFYETEARGWLTKLGDETSAQLARTIEEWSKAR